jgi:hypothetical protein
VCSSDLDVLDGLTVKTAFSVSRRLLSAYAGSLFRVRRSSDNAEQDIGTINGLLDQGALLTFVGAGDGFIRTIYDQSGNSYDAGNSTAASQPIIVQSGALVDDINGYPCLYFDGTRQLQLNTTTLQGGTGLSVLTSAKTSGDANADSLDNYNTDALWGGLTSTYAGVVSAGSENVYTVYQNTVFTHYPVSKAMTYPANGVFASRGNNNNTTTVWFNGGTGTTGAAHAPFNTGNTYIGSGDLATTFLTGHIGEFVAIANANNAAVNQAGAGLAELPGSTWTSV